MTQAEIFNEFMWSTWGLLEDGPNYETYKNAVAVAQCMSAKHNGSINPIDTYGDKKSNDESHMFVFPDGSTIWIVVNDVGIGIGCHFDGREPLIPCQIAAGPARNHLK